ncbi:MAG: divalent-cation tolerance protein CutA [Methanothermobacter sp.]|nr:divalent-cation tolerance protein CutA [Methanothermobacter sp.]
MFAMVYITTSGLEESEKIGKILVKERLAGCVNIIPSIRSFYWWDDKIEEDEESILIVKTIEENVKEIIKRVKALHSYENPCIIHIPIKGGSEDYFEWLLGEIR